MNNSISLAKRRGAALLIVLAFVVLLAAVVVAYMARSIADRPLAQAGFGTAAADQLARSALAIIATDFKQEIANAGLPPTEGNIAPQRSGNFSSVPNLVRRSVSNDPASAPAVASRASGVNSTTDVSLNGRYISSARWNKHYLIPRLNAGSTSIDTTPIATFVAPDWVLVTNSGPTVLGAPNTSVLGRYAYAVYDEGGLLDINVAGFPNANSTDATYVTNIGRKGVLAFADLTAIGMSVSSTSAGNTSYGSIDNAIGWRNYLSALPTGAYKTFSFPTNPTNFVTYFLDQSRTFLAVAVPVSYPSSGSPPRIDQSFITRAQLLELRRTITASQDAMQYLGTFSRESNKSNWSDSATKLSARFPLSRFDLFTNPTGNSAAIQQYFGLKYVPAAPPTAEHWQYVGISGATLQSSIPTITGTNVDPDLMRLLQYALPGGSVGEILSIAASLIDQRDANDDTTWIEYDSPSGPQKAFGVDRNASTEPDAPPQPNNVVVLNRAFRNVGELGYAFRNASTSLDFRASGSSDGPLLDLFTYNTAASRAGTVNLNSQNPGVIAAIIKGAFSTESASTGVNLANATSAANKVISDASGTATHPALGRQDVPRLASATGSTIGSTQEEQETIARALAEVTQTRTWGLFIDVIAQSGRYPPTATSLDQFVVEGEKRYWLHVAMDRFTGEVIDQQLEEVFE